ncbi:MAG: molybdate ABC transporter permease subunit [Planctomycetota bacterium]
MDYTALRLTLTLATATTLLLALVGIPVAWLIARGRWPGRAIVEALLSIPLVLPPTVLGFYLLRGLGPQSVVGGWYEHLTGGQLPFTFTGLLIASIVGNVPFLMRPTIAALARVDERLIEASWCLGESRLATFWRVTLPLAGPGIVAGIVMTFAHVLGEFGVVLMVGGNIPGVTRTLSIAIYDDVQALDYAAAARTSWLLILFAVTALALVEWLELRQRQRTSYRAGVRV